MKGFRINPDKKYVNIILEGLQRKDGHCPCRIDDSDATLCPCDEFTETKVCKCKLYISTEEAMKIIDDKQLNKEKEK